MTAELNSGYTLPNRQRPCDRQSLLNACLDEQYRGLCDAIVRLQFAWPDTGPARDCRRVPAPQPAFSQRPDTACPSRGDGQADRRRRPGRAGTSLGGGLSPILTLPLTGRSSGNPSAFPSPSSSKQRRPISIRPGRSIPPRSVLRWRIIPSSTAAILSSPTRTAITGSGFQARTKASRSRR